MTPPTADDAPVARLVGVSHVYGGRGRGRGGPVEALRDVDLTLDRGVLTALLGVNGSGKSTLLALLAAVRPPTAGRVEVLGRSTSSLGSRSLRRLRARLAYARQGAALDPEMFVRETLALMATLYGLTGAERRRRVDELLAAFRLGDLARRRVDELSGGQRRRLHLAASLVHDPELVLLDEPAAGLDAPGTEALWADLLRRAEAGCAVVLVTHELEAAERHAGRVVILESGRVVADGAPSALAATGPGRDAPGGDVPGGDAPSGETLGAAFRRLTGHDPEELQPAKRPHGGTGRRGRGRS